jgi:hypothetical protein
LTSAHAIVEADRNVQQAEQRTLLYRLVQRLESSTSRRAAAYLAGQLSQLAHPYYVKFADTELVGDTASSGGRQERLAAVDQRVCV